MEQPPAGGFLPARARLFAELQALALQSTHSALLHWARLEETSPVVFFFVVGCTEVGKEKSC